MKKNAAPKKSSGLNRIKISMGALIGLLITAPLTAILYFANQWAGLPFVPFDLFDWVTRVLPGAVVTFGIDMMIDTLRFLGINVADAAKAAERMIAILQFLVAGILVCMIYVGVIRKADRRPDFFSGIITGIITGVPSITISVAIGQSPVSPVFQILWLLIVFLAWGLALSLFCKITILPVKHMPSGTEQELRALKSGRRKFLLQMGSAAILLTAFGTLAGSLLSGRKRKRLDEELNGSAAHNTETGEAKPLPNLDDPVTPAPGTRPEYTPLKDHYKVYIRTKPTAIDGSAWVLPITGLVDNPLMLSIEDIKTRYPVRNQYITLSCISGHIGTSLISTTLWTGVSVQDILADARVRDKARYLYITSGDGYYETVSLETINTDKRIMFCYAWDGHDLPVDHGYPLRIWIPDRYGMKQPKWITGIEVTDEYKEGYWVKRNWDKTARVKTTSVIDTVALNAVFKNGDQKLVPVGGIAFSGARGISKVEVRVDQGPWKEARLRAPLSETTWVIWRYEWPWQKGEHVFEVRCAEADGTPQIEEENPPRPSGATGIHSVRVHV